MCLEAGNRQRSGSRRGDSHCVSPRGTPRGGASGKAPASDCSTLHRGLPALARASALRWASRPWSGLQSRWASPPWLGLPLLLAYRPRLGLCSAVGLQSWWVSHLPSGLHSLLGLPPLVRPPTHVSLPLSLWPPLCSGLTRSVQSPLCVSVQHVVRSLCPQCSLWPPFPVCLVPASRPPWDAPSSEPLCPGAVPSGRPVLGRGTHLSLVWPPGLVLAASLQWASALPVWASQPRPGLQSATGSMSCLFGFLHTLWSSTRGVASTPQWASRHRFSLLASFWLSHCHSPQPPFCSPTLRWASRTRVGPPGLVWPLLCHEPPTLGPASALPWAFHAWFVLPPCVGPQFWFQPPRLGVVCRTGPLLEPGAGWGDAGLRGHD